METQGVVDVLSADVCVCVCMCVFVCVCACVFFVCVARDHACIGECVHVHACVWGGDSNSYVYVHIYVNIYIHI